MSKLASIVSRRIQVTLKDRTTNINAVYEDTIPTGSSVGTVIAYHGSPGSHDCFKYVTADLEGSGIRLIGLNYPGFGVTEGYENQGFSNDERHKYTETLLDEIGVSGKIICLGHSRGCENALITAVERNVHGLVMICPIGLRPHKGIRPVWFLNGFSAFTNFVPASIGHWLVHQLYKVIGFRVKSGEEASNCLSSMANVALDGQLPYIQKLNESKTKVFITYAGKDHLTETEVIDEVLEKGYVGIKKLRYKTDVDTDTVMNSLKNEKGVAVLVDEDNHFQNKSRAKLVAAAIRNMLGS